MILAAALVLSMASCTETSPGTNLPVVTQTPDSSVPDTSLPDPDSSVNDKLTPPTTQKPVLTPPTTELDDITNSEYTDFTYFSKAEDYDGKTKIRRYYEGEIKDEKYTKQIFEKLTSILKNNHLTLSGEQSVSGGGNALLTFKKKNGDEYKLCKGILTYHPMEEGGEEVYMLITPHAVMYFGTDCEQETTLESQVTNGVKTEENLTKTVNPQERQTPDKGLVKPANPIVFMTVRSNAAWGFSLSGTCIDTAGIVYSFDFSKTGFQNQSAKEKSFEKRVLEYINTVGVRITGAACDTNKLKEALSCASKIDPNAQVTQEYAMCDCGQNTIYAVVNGTPIMLRSKGDVDMTVKDDNAQKAITLYENLLSSAVAPAICE